MNDIQLPLMFMPVVLVAALWSIFWKGTALWNAARKGNKIWFIVMLFVNTLGILEVIYLFCVAKIKTDKLFK